MPLIVHDQQYGNTILAVWEIGESEEDLIQLCLGHPDLPGIAALPLRHQRLEKLAVRALLQTLMPGATLSHTGSGKPVLDSANISISHSRGMAAILCSRECRTGIDIERMGEKVVKLAPRFASEEELGMIPTSDPSAMLHAIWGAKESIYKLHGLGELDFREHIHVLPFSLEKKGILTARLLKQGVQETFTVSYERLENHMLVWVLSPEL